MRAAIAQEAAAAGASADLAEYEVSSVDAVSDRGYKFVVPDEIQEDREPTPETPPMSFASRGAGGYGGLLAGGLLCALWGF